MPEVTDLLGLAIDKNPTDFASAIDDILRSKAAIALENKKNELAQSVYGSDDTDSTDEVDFETADQEDDDFDDEDFEIDLEDLDLEDLDLEDLDGDELDA
jgi:hypothetical protein